MRDEEWRDEEWRDEEWRDEEWRDEEWRDEECSGPPPSRGRQNNSAGYEYI